MIDLVLTEYLDQKRGTFHSYFFWPVFRKENITSEKVVYERLEGGSFKTRTDSVPVPNKEMSNFGPDIIYQEISDNFGVAFGTFSKKGSNDIVNSIIILEELGLVPIRFEKATLLEFLRKPNNYAGYRLSEYRGKYGPLQSYFKDDEINSEENKSAILRRLSEDEFMGIKPYQATFRSEEGNGMVKVFESGAVFTDKPQDNIRFIENIIEKILKQGRSRVSLAKNVKIEYLKKVISLQLHSDMLIQIEEAKADTINSFINGLGRSTNIYGIWSEDYQHFMNIQYQKTLDDKKKITSTFSISIEPSSIIVTPTMGPELEDTLSFFYDVDKHFKIKHAKEVSAV